MTKKLLLGFTLTCVLGALVPSAKSQSAFVSFQPDNGCQSVGYVPPYSYTYWECAVSAKVFVGFTVPELTAIAYSDLTGYCTISFTIYGWWKGSTGEMEAHTIADILPQYTAESWQSCIPQSTGSACISYGGEYPC